MLQILNCTFRSLATYGRPMSDKQQQVGETGLTATTAAAASCTAQQLPSRRPRHHSGPKAAEVTYSKLIAGHLQMATRTTCQRCHNVTD